MNKIHAVVIGRNESERLDACFLSLLNQVDQIIYVDSGSTDSSVLVARKYNCNVIELNSSAPYTAARARNAGFSEVKNNSLSTDYVQFVDGDCELSKNWITTGTKFLDEHPECGIVCGRTLEKYPNQSIYNFLCDLEWDTPVGDTNRCGGIALIRITAFDEIGGFNPKVIAAEDDEMCHRMLEHGWKIWRLDCDMAHHDANIRRFEQWWKRMTRGGYAFAMGVHIHGFSSQLHLIKMLLRSLFWGFFLPILLIAAIPLSQVLALMIVLIFAIKILISAYKLDKSFSVSLVTSLLFMVAKFAEAYGVIKYLIDYIKQRDSQIIEYK